MQMLLCRLWSSWEFAVPILRFRALVEPLPHGASRQLEAFAAAGSPEPVPPAHEERGARTNVARECIDANKNAVQ